MKRPACLLALSVVSGSAFAIVGVDSVDTTLDGNGDRFLNRMTFEGSSSVFESNSVGNWRDGRLSYGNSSYGWTDKAPRDMSTSGNEFAANPDRADRSSRFADEATNQGTLKEVFESRNLSWIIDGEDTARWTLELLLGEGQFIANDGNSRTVELAFLERGGNSDLGVKGIYVDRDGNRRFTDAVIIRRGEFSEAGWTLDTLEIDHAQKVVGAGLSLNEFGRFDGRLIGVKLFAESDFNGPDLVDVMTAQPVPEPATLGALGVGIAALLRRRRK